MNNLFSRRTKRLESKPLETKPLDINSMIDKIFEENNFGPKRMLEMKEFLVYDDKNREDIKEIIDVIYEINKVGITEENEKK